MDLKTELKAVLFVWNFRDINFLFRI